MNVGKFSASTPSSGYNSIIGTNVSILSKTNFAIEKNFLPIDYSHIISV